MDRLRVDKWLWAARFFKTRSIAKTAIEGGKVHLEGQRVKVSREISVGEILVIKQGWDEKEVVVRALSAQRGPAPIARELYEETECLRYCKVTPHLMKSSEWHQGRSHGSI